MVPEEALKKLQEQIAAWPMAQRFVVQQLIEDYLRNREDVRAYEATGLTAEEVSTLVKDWNDLCTIVGECGGNYCPNCGAKMDGGDSDALD